MVKKAKKRAEFIKLPNIIKGKVGSGGLSDAILAKAQQLLEEHQMDFTPAAMEYLGNLQVVIELVQSGADYEPKDVLAQMIFPCVELQSHGTMFHFDLVSTISSCIIGFLKKLEHVDDGILEIMGAYHSTIRAIVIGKIYGAGGERGEELLKTLSDACDRYLSQRA